MVALTYNLRMKIFLALFLAIAAVLSVSASAAENELLKEGDVAPGFTLPTSTGETVSLSSFRDKKAVVLYFYPKDNTPGCTKEAQSFRDDQEKFKKAGAVVLGVSVDDEKSHKYFAEKQKLNFPLLVDAGGKVARQYGAMGWIMAKRVTYVIGTDGKIKNVFPDVDVEAHSKEVLKAVTKR